MHAKLFKNWWLLALRGVIFILLGLMILFNPAGGLLGLALYIGIATLIAGVFEFIAAFQNQHHEGWGWYLAEGIVDIVFGLILLSQPALTVLLISFILGFWTLFGGVMQIAGSFSARKDGVSNWWWWLLSGIVCVILGYWIITNPISVGLSLTVLIGLALLIIGIFVLLLSLRLRKFGNRVQEAAQGK
jgi:uncharacterized membrane protein HdeD (DUF308 family)